MDKILKQPSHKSWVSSNIMQKLKHLHIACLASLWPTKPALLNWDPIWQKYTYFNFVFKWQVSFQFQDKGVQIVMPGEDKQTQLKVDCASETDLVSLL